MGPGLAAGAPTASFNSGGDNNEWGWTIGAGMEYALTNNWTAKIEYLYADLGNGGGIGRCFVGCAVFNPALVWNGGERRADMHIVRAGINYKF